MYKLRVATTVVVLFSLTAVLSCDLLLAPKQGRWNPNDPNADLETVSQTLYPAEDGYLGSTLPWNDFSVEINAKNDEYCLLKFDISTLPDMITTAQLQLYCTVSPGDSNVSAHEILQSWDPATINWVTVSSSEFFDPNPITTTYVDAPSLTYSWTLDDAVYDLGYGILLMGDDLDEVRFASSEATTNPPVLTIEGYNKK